MDAGHRCAANGGGRHDRSCLMIGAFRHRDRRTGAAPRCHGSWNRRTRCRRIVPSFAQPAGTHASPTIEPTAALRRADVTRPTQVPSCTIDEPSGGSQSPEAVNPTSRSRGPVFGEIGQRPLAQEVVLVGLDHPAQPDLERVGFGVGVLADQDVLLLEAQDALGLQAEGLDAVALPRCHELVPHVLAVHRREMDLVAQLAHEADAQHQRRHARDLHARRAQVRQRLGGHVRVGDRATSPRATPDRRG